MPKALTYRVNSVIYFQGDQAERVFILQQGKVSLNYQDIETGQDIHELIKTGEFFGVKSALGHYPREETALVLQDATVLAFTVPEFEALCSQNTRIILKMLKVFSNQLRRIHNQVVNLLDQGEQVSPEAGLYKSGEYYLKNRQYAQALYIFSRYLTYFPSGKFAQEAARNLEVAENSSAKYGQGKGPAPLVQAAALQRGGSDAAGPSVGEEPAASAPAKASGGGEALSDSAKQYYNAVSIFSQEKYQQAYLEFKKIVEKDEDPEYVAKSVFEQGRCMFALGQLDGALAHYSKMFQTYPKHPDLTDALFIMGQCYEKKGDKAKAAGFYKKLMSMGLDEDDSTRLKARKALKAIEG